MRKRETLQGRDRQREETRARLYEAALDVFRRDGVGACRIDDIVATLGLSRAAFYFHFPTKEDVLLELERRTDERVAAAVRALPVSASLDAVLERLSVTMREVWEPDAVLFPDAVVAFLRTGASAVVADRQSSGLRVAMAERFRLAAERGELKDLLDPGLMSDLFLTHVLGGMLGWCAQPVVPLDQVLKIVAQLFLEGVGMPRRAASPVQPGPTDEPPARSAAPDCPPRPRTRRGGRPRST